MKIYSIIKRFFLTVTLLIGSVLLSLIIAEGILRIVLNPGDYLTPKIISDDVLGIAIEPNSAGHDSWGFRNKLVPASADIVTIGDSQTYGNNASANDSWPKRLGQLYGRSVYNLASGGYGPPQYSYLLETKALKLKPDLIIAGFYFGNDLINTYISVYDKDYWISFRNQKISLKSESHAVNKIDIADKQQVFTRQFRIWLREHCVIYRLLSYQIANKIRYLEMKSGWRESSGTTIFKDNSLGIRTEFTPKMRLNVLELNDYRVKEGLRITLELFYRMNEICSEKGIDFLILMIPTKESVFGDYIENNSDLANFETIDSLLMNERKVNEIMKDYFQKHDLKYFDVLTPLKKILREKKIYLSNTDGHPNRVGYGVIAESICKYLQTVEEN